MNKTWQQHRASVLARTALERSSNEAMKNLQLLEDMFYEAIGEGIHAGRQGVEEIALWREASKQTDLLETAHGWKEAPFRMDAYYYSFDPTGVLGIDKILSAVACAGKALHNTSEWASEKVEPWEEFMRGNTPAEWIQNSANDFAKILTKA